MVGVAQLQMQHTHRAALVLFEHLHDVPHNLPGPHPISGLHPIRAQLAVDDQSTRAVHKNRVGVVPPGMPP